MRRYVRDRRGRFAKTGRTYRRRLPRKTGYKAPWSEDLIGRQTRKLGRTPIVGKDRAKVGKKRQIRTGWERFQTRG